MKNRNSLYWKLCYVGVILLCILTFTPLVIPSGRYGPMIAGIPRTLWVGILVYIGLVLLTLVATSIYRERDVERGEGE